MKTEFKEVAHLYLGCEVKENSGLERTLFLKKVTNGNPSNIVEVGVALVSWNMYFTEIKPILRPLSDMTEVERTMFDGMHLSYSETKWPFIGIEPQQFTWLLKQDFDLFNLIESGQAIDRSTLSTPTDKQTP